MSGLLALAAILGSSNDAVAQTVGLAKAGPIDPATNYPLFYEDTNGLRLGLCRNADACAFLLPDPSLPEHYPQFPGDPASNFPDESFYWSAGADMTGIAGARAIMTIALEAAFVNGSVEYQENMVFARVRLRITGLVDGGTYTITHPYGQEVLVAGVDGPLPGTINITRDVGIGVAMDFTTALSGDIGPFLVPVGFFGGFPGQLISDGATETQVTGSPNLTNYLRISGPSAHTLFPANANGFNRAQINTFVITGQIAPQLGAGVDKVTVEKTSTATAVNVWASTAAAQSLAISIDGSPGIAMQGGGADGQYFARAVFPAGTPTPSSVSVTNLTDFPATTFPSDVVADTVEILGATFTVGSGMTVNARSTDKVGNPALTVSWPGFAPVALAPLGNGEAGGPVAVPPGMVPPKTVTVESAAGGAAVANVVIVGAGAVGGGAPLVADAGVDVTVQSGTAVTLNGLASIGNITAYAWSHDAGASIFLVGGDTATPNFVAPNVAANQQVDIHFTLLVQDGFGGSIDTMVVHVMGPIGPIDHVTVASARYTVSKGTWRINGSDSLIQGQSVSIYVGAIGNRSRLIAVVPVSTSGTWSFLGQATPSSIALPTDSEVWAESNIPNTPGSAAIRRL